MSLIIWPSKKYYELLITALFLSWESFLLKSVYPVKIRTWTPSYFVCFWLVFFLFPLIVWILYICIENRLKLWNKLSQFINKKFVELLSNQTLTDILDEFLWCQKKSWCPIIYSIIIFNPKYCCCSVTHLCQTLWDPMICCSTAGIPVLHHFPELAQTYVHWINDAIQSSCSLLLLPSIFPNIRVFSNELARRIKSPEYWRFSFSIVLQMNIQDSFPLGLTGLISLQSKGLSRIFSNTTVQKHQLLGSQSSLWFSSHIHTWLLEKQ